MPDISRLSRRHLLRWGLALVPLGVASRVFALSSTEPTSTLVKRVVRSPKGTYFTYPHSNGFLADGSCVLASPTGNPGNGPKDIVRFDLEREEASLITRVSDSRMYYAVSGNGQMLFDRVHGVSVVDLTKKNQPVRDVFSDAGIFPHDCDISVDGSSALVTHRHAAAEGSASQPGKLVHRLDLIDIASGKARTLVVADWVLDHAHFSPFDPSWISYCCDEPKRYQRMWVWHAKQAPKGRPLFEQVKSDGTKFDIGHERAMFNKAASVVIAYGSESDAQPCGLYEVGFDGTTRLISESNRDFHCNVSRDGRWAVVSLQGTLETLESRPKGNWRSHAEGYGFSDVMVVNMKNGRREFLYRATNSAKGQPYEVQPTISPDGRWVVMKDASEQRVIGVEVDQSKLAAFLS